MPRLRRHSYRRVLPLLSIVAVLGSFAHASASGHGAGRSGWRTVVIPAPVAHNSGWTAHIVTGSLGSEPRSKVRPLLGVAHILEGIASFYWQDQMTASGERFDRNAFTAAHRTLPMGTRVRVTHLASGRNVVVRINDRGPFTPGRVIDLSKAAAEHIGMTANGLARVRIDVVR
jgi:hypothetical protein